MVAIIKTGEAPTVGKGTLAQEELMKIIKFCKKFDIVDGEIKPDSPYIFDVRPEAVHLLNKESKEIQTSMYMDRSKGNMTIELGDDQTIDANAAVQKWAEVITNALKG